MSQLPQNESGMWFNDGRGGWQTDPTDREPTGIHPPTNTFEGVPLTPELNLMRQAVGERVDAEGSLTPGSEEGKAVYLRAGKFFILGVKYIKPESNEAMFNIQVYDPTHGWRGFLIQEHTNNLVEVGVGSNQPYSGPKIQAGLDQMPPADIIDWAQSVASAQRMTLEEFIHRNDSK